jgi:hypothetical protein
MGDLVLMKPEPKAWEQQVGEDDASFSYFGAWLLKQPRYNVAGYEIAQRWNWAQRAVIYDNHMYVQGKSPGQLMKQAFDAIGRAVSREAQKLYERVLEQPAGTNVLTPGELTKLLTLISEHPDLFASAGNNPDVDLTKFTEIELRILQAGHQIIKGANDRQ